MDAYIRASSLQGFAELVDELGGDPDALLLGAGIDPGLDTDPDAYLPYCALGRVLEDAAAAVGRSDFGLLLSRRQGAEILGPVALMARHAPTARLALAALRRWSHVYSTGFEGAVERLDAQRARFTFTVVASHLPERVQLHELSVGVSIDLFGLLLGPGFRPRRVLLPHAAVGPPEGYRRVLGAPVVFEADVCGFEFDGSALDRPRAGDDPQVRRVVEAYLTATDAGGPDLDVAGRVRILVRRTLPTGQAALTTIATHLRMHPRTLQRRLRGDGTTFELLVDEVRRERAEHYLRHSDRSLGQVATLLGYTEQSCLSRSARRWFGTTAQDVRARARHPAGEPVAHVRRSPA